MSIARHLMPALLLTGALAPSGCFDDGPVVEVKTHVGPSHARHDEALRREHARTVASTVLAGLRPLEGKEAEAALAEAVYDEPLHPPADAEQFARLVEAVRQAPLDELGGPARRLAAADPRVWPEIRQALLAERKAPKADYRALLDAIGGDVPNRYGHFARAWKKAHGFDVKLSQDWFEDLLSMSVERVVPGLRAVYRDCVLQTALLRAASVVGKSEPALTGEVVATLLDAAYAHEGTFRDEVGRAIVAIGDEAVPHLLRASDYAAPRRDDREDPAALRADYALLQLDKLDRLHPERAVAAVREDPRRLVALVEAYGDVRPGEAASVLLALADAVDPAVRAAARRAFMAYVEGPPPDVRARKIRLLGGGTSTALAQLSYRQRASLAIRERVQAELPAALEPACEVRRENGTMDQACLQQPERLARAYFSWLHDRRRSADERAIAAALAEPDVRARVEQLDRLLATSPALEGVERLVSVYEEAAEVALADGEAARAGQLLRKAARLAEPDDAAAAPGGASRAQASRAEALRVRALLAEASVPELGPEGRRMLLTSAQQLAPEDPRVDAALAQLDHREGAVAPGRWAPVAGMVMGLWGLGALGSWLRRRRDIPVV